MHSFEVSLGVWKRWPKYIFNEALPLWETYCFCSVSYYHYYYYYYYSLSSLYSPFFLWHMNLSTADLRKYWTEFHETVWSYRYMFLVGPKVDRKSVGIKCLQNYLSKFHQISCFMIFLRDETTFLRTFHLSFGTSVKVHTHKY